MEAPRFSWWPFIIFCGLVGYGIIRLAEMIWSRISITWN